MTSEYELTDLGATEYGALVRDARRYRWLREQWWFDGNMCVVANPKRLLTQPAALGTYCPSKGNLDAAIDAAMEAAK